MQRSSNVFIMKKNMRLRVYAGTLWLPVRLVDSALLSVRGLYIQRMWLPQWRESLNIPLSGMLPTVLCHLLFAVWEVTPPALFINSVRPSSLAYKRSHALNCIITWFETHSHGLKSMKRKETKWKPRNAQRGREVRVCTWSCWMCTQLLSNYRTFNRASRTPPPPPEPTSQAYI